MKCIGAILRDNVSSTTSGQWRAAFEAGGRAVGINADRIQKPLGPLAELDRERLNIFFDGAIAGKKGTSTSRQGSVLQAFAYLLDVYRVSRALPRLLTAAEGSFLPGSFGFVERGVPAPDATPSAAPAAAARDGGHVDAQVDPQPAPLSPLDPPTRQWFIDVLGARSGLGLWSILSLLVNKFGNLHHIAGVPRGAQADPAARGRHFDAAFGAVFRRLCMLRDSGWANLMSLLVSAAADVAMQHMQYAAVIRTLSADALAQRDEVVQLRQYLHTYANAWGIEPTLDRFLPAEVPTAFWGGSEFWSFWPSVEQMAIDLSPLSKDAHATLCTVAAASGWSPYGSSPLLHWLAIGGADVHQRVEANISLLKRLNAFDQAHLHALSLLWSKVRDLSIGRRKEAPDIASSSRAGQAPRPPVLPGSSPHVGPPTLKDISHALGKGSRLWDNIVSFVETRGRIVGVPSRSSDLQRQRIKDSVFQPIVRRLAFLSEAGWKSFAGDVEAHVRSGKSSKGKQPGASEWAALRRYVTKYSVAWGAPPLLDTFFPRGAIPADFWHGCEAWSYWPSLEQAASDISAAEGGNSKEKLYHIYYEAAKATGWWEAGPEPLWYWLVSGGRQRQELVERNLAIPKRLKILPPEQRVPLISFWRMLNRVARERKREGAVEGDILGTVGGLVAVGSAQPAF